MTILLTGCTGNIGYEAARQLNGHRVLALVRDPSAEISLPNVKVIHDLDQARDCEVIIHSAANTAFRAPLEELRASNVALTQRLLDFAKDCPRLRRFVHVSTACVCGKDGGTVPESMLPRPTGFVNNYEQSKWEAEQTVHESGLPASIVRLSIVAGSEVDGHVRRRGALHHTLFWLWKGLIPMMPGTSETPVDIISTEHAARVIISAALAPESVPLLHACAGAEAAQLGELLQHLTAEFATHSAAWRSGAHSLPEIVDAETFALFEQTVQQSGDVLFQRVCADSKSFLPGLLHPRVYDTAIADALCPFPRADWRSLTSHVTHHVLSTHLPRVA